VLLENLLEYLLEKADFTGALRREFDYRSKEITLQSVAAFVKERGGWCSVNELLVHSVDFFRASGLSYNANEILDRLVHCGVLAQEGDDIQFKYRCFQEYFLAGKLAEDAVLYERVLSGEEYLLHSREIDLLSGKDRRRVDLLERLRCKIENLCPDEMHSVQVSDFSKIEIEAGTFDVTRAMLMDLRSQKITQEQIDDALDGAEGNIAHIASKDAAINKPASVKDVISEAKYIVTLDLYGRVIRNLEFIGVDDKRQHVDILLDSWVRFIAWYAKSWKDNIEEAIEEKGTQDKNFLANKGQLAEYILKVVMPMMFFAMIETGVATPKLESVLESKVRDGTSDPATRLVSLCMLLGLKAKNMAILWKEMWEEQKDNIYVSTLLFAKLSMYYMMTPMEKREKEGLERLISEVIVVDRRYPKRAKGHVISELRKQRQRVQGGTADLQG
jgi:hypothetical protein